MNITDRSGYIKSPVSPAVMYFIYWHSIVFNKFYILNTSKRVFTVVWNDDIPGLIEEVKL